MGFRCEVSRISVDEKRVVPGHMTVDRVSQACHACFAQFGSEHFHDTAECGSATHCIPHLFLQLLVAHILIRRAQQAFDQP